MTSTLPDGIRRRSDNGNLMVDYTDRLAVRHRSTHKTIEQANARLRQLHTADGERGVDEDGKVRTLGDAFKLAEVRWGKARAAHTLIANGREALDHFGIGQRLIGIGPLDIRAYRDALVAKGQADGTVNRKLSALRVMLSEAADVGAITHIPAVKKLKEAATRIRFVTPEEEALLVRTLEHRGCPQAADMAVFLIDTGLRVQQEALAVQKHHLQRREDGRTNLLVPDGKGGKARTIPLTLRAELIASKCAENSTSNLRIFDIGYSKLYRQMTGAFTQLGWEDVNIHTLRHTCASRLAQRGVPLIVIKDFLGHTNIATTMRYAHLATEHLTQAMEALEQ